MKDLLLFGMQGSGKGTQGKLLAQKYGYIVFDTGSALRAIAKEESELGKKVKETLESGNLVTLEIVMAVLQDFVNKQDATTPLLFDGIPRNEDQRIGLEKIMQEANRKPVALHIEIEREVAEKRLLQRKICVSCNAIFGGDHTGDICSKCGDKLIVRKDDTPEAITQRLDIFFDQTLPILAWYKEKERVVTVNGLQDVQSVHEEILDKLELENKKFIDK